VELGEREAAQGPRIAEGVPVLPRYPHMTSGQNLAFPAHAGKVTRPDRGRKVEETAKILEPDAIFWIRKPPLSLSGGQRPAGYRWGVHLRQSQGRFPDGPSHCSNLDAKLARAQMRAPP